MNLPRAAFSAAALIGVAVCFGASASAATPTPTTSSTPIATKTPAATNTPAPSATPTVEPGSMIIRGQVPVVAGTPISVDALDPEHIRPIRCAVAKTTGPDSSNPSSFVLVVTPECVAPPSSGTLSICWIADACSTVEFAPGDVDVGLLPIPVVVTRPNPGGPGSPSAAQPRSLPSTGTRASSESRLRSSAIAMVAIASVLGLIATISGVSRSWRGH